MLLDSQLVGWLVLFSHTPEEVSLSCRRHLESIVHQIVNAIFRLRRDQALEISEQRLRRLFEQIPSGMLVTGMDGTILMVNPAARHWLGLPEDAVGKPLRRWIAEEESLVSHERHEQQRAATIVVADGKTRLLGATSVLIQLGSSNAVITVFRDIGRIREIAERRRRAEQLAQVGAMAAKLSHEIKNPLASILTGLRILEMEGTYSSRHNSVLQEAIDDVRRLAEIVQELLGSSKPAESYPAPTSLTRLLLDSGSAWDDYAKSREVALEVSDLLAEDVTVVVDQGLIRRVLFNLVQNAIEATGPGGQVQIAWRPVGLEEMEQRFPGYGGGKVTAIEVRDNGPGISRANIKRIFKPFVTTKSAGTGLGLAISEEIINHHGGVLSVESRPGEGATFRIYLVVGERPPCWEIARDVCFKSCDDCPVYDRTPGYYCWTYLGQTHLSETGDWPDSCLECPMYRDHDLGQYYRHPERQPTVVADAAVSGANDHENDD